jgi:hypothetical protein
VRRSGRAARLAVVGSVAEGTRDLFSDLDLLVACDRPRSDGEAVLAAIHAAVPVLCRRLFPDREPPSGRYWFRDHLPPNKLDVSFHRPGELRRLAGDMAGHGLAVRIVELDPDPSAAAPPRTPWVEVPGDLADELHRVSRALRRYARSGRGAGRSRAPARAAGRAPRAFPTGVPGCRRALAGDPVAADGPRRAERRGRGSVSVEDLPLVRRGGRGGDGASRGLRLRLTRYRSATRR